MKPEALRGALAQADGPTIVCAQAGNVATGAFDAFEPIAEACAAHNAWLLIEGAFGLRAAAAPATRYLTRGVERATPGPLTPISGSTCLMTQRWPSSPTPRDASPP